MAQTAIDWIIKELELEGYNHTIEIAKQKEKEQIMHAYWNGTTDMEKPDALLMAEKFYNEYYGA